MNKSTSKKADFIKEIALESFGEFAPREFFADKKNIGSAWSKYDFSDKKINANFELKIKKYVLNDDIHSGLLLQFENIVFFTFDEAIRVIAQLISRQPNGEDGELVTNGCWNILFTESEEYGSKHPFTIMLGWVKADRMWFLTGRKPFYTNDGEYDPATSVVFINSPIFDETKEKCIAKVQATDLSNEIKHEFIRHINRAPNDKVFSVFANIIESTQYKASEMMDKIVKYRETKYESELWKKYWPLYSSWTALRDFFLQTFKEHDLSEQALKEPAQV